MLCSLAAVRKKSRALPFPDSLLVTSHLLGILFAWTLQPVAARTVPKIESSGSAVVVNRRVAVRFSASNGRSKPSERAQTVASRLQVYAARGLAPSAVRPGRDGKDWRVVVKGQTSLINVTRADGKINRSQPKALAHRWASQIRKALAVPPVALSPGRLVIPLGETRTVKLDGYAEGQPDIALKQSAPTLQLIHPPGERQFKLRGEKTGKAIVQVKVGRNTANCVVEVKKWAGRVPLNLTAEVTGAPAAPPDLVLNAAAAVLRHAPREPGAKMQIKTPLRTVSRALAPGKSQTFTTRVTLKGPGYLTSEGVARIRVVNRALPMRPTARMFYSNSPEHITGPATLYAATLNDDAPTRIMYHHDNHTRGTIVVAVTVSNLSDKDARLHLMPGFVEQGSDPAHVGFRAGRVYLGNLMKHRGEVCVLPAHSTVPLVLQRLRSRMTASGIAQIRLLDPPEGARCRVEIKAVSPSKAGFQAQARNRLDPWRHTLPRPLSQTELASFENLPENEIVYCAKRTLEAEYTVGDKWTFIPLGRDGALPPDADAPPQNADISGDYGVLYNIRVTIKNPHASSKKVSLIFAPGGGMARAVFNINGRYQEVRDIRPPHQHLLAQVTLKPRETRVVTLQTVPLGGSSYPANVIVR